MFRLIKLAFVASVVFVVCGFLSFALLVGVADATSEWGPASAENAMIALLVAIGAIQALGVVGVGVRAWKTSRGIAGLGIVATYTLVSLVTVGWTGLMSMVVFNR